MLVPSMAELTTSFEIEPGPYVPGSEFKLLLYISTDVETLGAGYSLRTDNEAHLSIGARSLGIYTDPTLVDVDGVLVNENSTEDLGATREPISNPAQPGQHLLVATFTIDIANNAIPDSYRIRLFNGIVVDKDFNSIPMEASADVIIVPEPPAFMLLSCLTLLRLRKL